MVLIIFIVGGLLASAGFFGMLGTLLASPMIGLTSGFIGLTYSLGPFVGIGLASFVLFLAGLYLLKIAFGAEVE